jgi:hypothetical protein
MANVPNETQRPMPNWLMGGNPRAIEDQELQGQRHLCSNRDIMQLPVEANGIGDAHSEYKKMGIEVIKNSAGDNLFYDVKIPKGWTLEASDHAMWSYLKDETGKERAQVFYKAAFYDRKAFVNITK